MATVKRANVAPTHPSVWIGLALSVVGLLVALFAYTGSRIYDITYAIIAVVGAIVALAGILVSAWGRSIMASRASRSRRETMRSDALAMAKPMGAATAEDAPTIAAPAEKKRFAFGRKEKNEPEEKASAAGVFAFRRPKKAEPERAADDPRNPIVSERLAEAPAIEVAPAPEPAPPAAPVRLTLKCPQCGTQFSAEGVRPFEARCSSCGFTSTV